MPSNSNVWTMGRALQHRGHGDREERRGGEHAASCQTALDDALGSAEPAVCRCCSPPGRCWTTRGGELLSTVRATASCCSPARMGAMATTRLEKPAEVASASSRIFWRRPMAGAVVPPLLEHIGEPTRPPAISRHAFALRNSSSAWVPGQALHGLGVRCSITAHPTAWRASLDLDCAMIDVVDDPSVETNLR